VKTFRKGARKMENLEACSRTLGCFTYSSSDGWSMLFNFSLSIRQLLLVGYCNMHKCHQEQFCMEEGMYFSDCKNETKKFRDW
jgi:hypothetical protein